MIFRLDESIGVASSPLKLFNLSSWLRINFSSVGERSPGCECEAGCLRVSGQSLPVGQGRVQTKLLPYPDDVYPVLQVHVKAPGGELEKAGQA